LKNNNNENSFKKFNNYSNMKMKKRMSAPNHNRNADMVQSNMHLERRMAPLRATSLNANELDDSDDEELMDEGGVSGGGGGSGATTNVSESGGGSSTFKIERRTTILSDNKDHKVSIAIIELAPQFRYFTTPSLEAKAYLQVRAINNSVFSLLASDKVSVFFDGSFVCNTNLKQIMPGESFSVFLGTDSTVKVEHKLVKKSSNEGAAGTFMVILFFV
jgi:uncharacterized protein (TIGR02231 family)